MRQIARMSSTRATEHRQHRISVILDQDLGRRFEAYCDERGHKKSTLIARLIREHLEHEHFQAQDSLFQDYREKGEVK